MSSRPIIDFLNTVNERREGPNQTRWMLHSTLLLTSSDFKPILQQHLSAAFGHNYTEQNGSMVDFDSAAIFGLKVAGQQSSRTLLFTSSVS